MGGVKLNTSISKSNQLTSPEIEGKSPQTGTQKTKSYENKKGALASLKASFANLKAKLAGGEGKKAVGERIRNTKSLKNENPDAATKNMRAQIKHFFSSKEPKVVDNKLLIRYPDSDAITATTPEDAPPPYSLHDPLYTSTENNLDDILRDLEDIPPPSDHPGPPPPSYIPAPPTAKQLDGQAATRNDAHSLRSAISNGLTQALQGERGSFINKEDVQKFSDHLSIGLGLKPGKLSLDQYSALEVMKSELDAFLPPDVKSKFDALMQAEEIRLMKDRGMT